MGTENVLNGFLIAPQESGNTVVDAHSVDKNLKKHFLFFLKKKDKSSENLPHLEHLHLTVTAYGKYDPQQPLHLRLS